MLQQKNNHVGSLLLRKKVYNQLKKDIISCALPPGEDITESDLSSRFEISKSPVRDALMMLEREGLVISSPRQGYRVAPVSISDMFDMFHLRAALERANVERIIQYSTDQELKELDLFKTFSDKDWPDGFVSYNKAFHHRLAKMGKNRRMAEQLIDLIDLMERAVMISVSNLKRGDPQDLVLEHAELINAIQSRLVKQAQKIAEKHILEASKRVNKALTRKVIVK